MEKKEKITVSIIGGEKMQPSKKEIKQTQELYTYFTQTIKDLLEKYEMIECLTDTYLDDSIIWNLAVLEMQKKYPNRIILTMYLPFVSDKNIWQPSETVFYENSIKLADKLTYISKKSDMDMEHHELRELLDEMKFTMIKHSDSIIMTKSPVNIHNSNHSFNDILYTYATMFTIDLIKFSDYRLTKKGSA